MRFNQVLSHVMLVTTFWVAANQFGRGQDSFTEKYLDDAGGVVFEVDVRGLLKSKDLESVAKLLDIEGSIQRQLGFSVRNIETFAASTSGPQENPFRKFVLKADRDLDALQMMRTNRWIRPDDVPETKEYRDQSWYLIETRRGGIGVFQPSNQSIVVNGPEQVENLVKGKKPEQVVLRSREWQSLSDYQVRLGIGEAIFDQWREEYERFSKQSGSNDPIAQLVLPINQKILSAYGGLTYEKQLSLRVSLFAKNSTDAKEVKSSLEALVKIGQSMLNGVRDSLINNAMDEATKTINREGFVLLDKFIESLKFERFGKEVRITAKTDISAFVKNILPAQLDAARIAARRTQSANNLKQLGLSMHNFHDATKSFPPAVIIGPKGHKHSWRVAMLPYLEQKELYDQYKFDEPWDSPNNTKVMKQMPEVFRHPSDPAGSTNTRYLAFVGPGSPFENPEGVSFRDMRDGTSNTVMFFSGATNVPWTKPEDIVYDPGKEIEMQEGPFKNGFNAVFFDGSVQFLSKEMVEKQLHRLVQMADGQPIER